uniref:Uncharacterized protein n=1 Tax=Amphimedon queenslandica TaxID=400682 RepID=A0A1X7TA42_AMPQE
MYVNILFFCSVNFPLFTPSLFLLLFPPSSLSPLFHFNYNFKLS